MSLKLDMSGGRMGRRRWRICWGSGCIRVISFLCRCFDDKPTIRPEGSSVTGDSDNHHATLLSMPINVKLEGKKKT